MQNGTGPGDVGIRGNGHPGDNPFYSNIDSMPDIRPRRKSIPLVSELVSTKLFNFASTYVHTCVCYLDQNSKLNITYYTIYFYLTLHYVLLKN